VRLPGTRCVRGTNRAPVGSEYQVIG